MITDIDVADFTMADLTGYPAMAQVEYANGSTGLVGAVPGLTTWATLGLGLATVAPMLGEDPDAQVSKRVLVITSLQGAITKCARVCRPGLALALS